MTWRKNQYGCQLNDHNDGLVNIFAEPEMDGLPEKLQMTSDMLLDSLIIIQN